MSLAHATDGTIPAHPLGQPYDGRQRFGMTHEQARVYRWLLENRPHDEPFLLDFRDGAAGMGKWLGATAGLVDELVDRGWLTPAGPRGGYMTYSFVHPVMLFKERGR